MTNITQELQGFPGLEGFVKKFRQDIESCWDDNIAAHCYDLFPPGFEPPISAGTAVPTSVVLLDELRDRFSDQSSRFYLVYGRVLDANSVPLLGGRHCWVSHHPDLGTTPTVIDATADQLPRTQKIREGKPYIIGDLGALTVKGLIYQPFITYSQAPDKVREFIPEGEAPPNMTPLPERAALLRTRLRTPVVPANQKSQNDIPETENKLL